MKSIIIEQWPALVFSGIAILHAFFGSWEIALVFAIAVPIFAFDK